MSKHRKILLVLISLVTVFAIVGVVSAKTYDYANTPLLHKAYEGYDDNIPAAVPPMFEAELSPGNYTAISASDDNRALNTYPYYEFHRFEFHIDEPVSDIAQIDVLHEGYASDLLGGPGHSLYIWNYKDSKWQFVQTTSVAGPPDQTLKGTFTSGFSDYIEGGILQLLAITNSESSCPFLYTWDRTSYQFIADINSFGGFGYPQPTEGSPLRPPYSEDYTKIDGSQLVPEDGTYRLEIAEDQNEITYLDGVKLLAVDHSPDVEIYSPITSWYDDVPPFEIHTIKNPVSPISAVDGSGKNILPVIAKMDRECTEANNYRWNNITVDFGDLSGAKQIKLLYNAWVDWPGGPEPAERREYVESHPGEQMIYMPYAEVINENGEWQRVSDEEHFGLPQAKPRTMVLDITDWFKTNDYRLRIHNWYATHIDYIAVDTSQDEEVSVDELAPVSADLHWKGVSVQSSPDGKEPAIPDYYDTADIAGFSVYEGKFTRYGDVLPLLTEVDDKFVIMHAGDSISVNFDERAVPEGMERDYYLFSDAYYKQNFVKEFLGQDVSNVEPLPFHAMSNYPYPATESYPSDSDHSAYLEEYNTREFKASPSPEPGHHTIYTDYVSVQITPRTNVTNVKYLHAEGGLINMTDPVGTQWNELYPLFGREYHISNWTDTGGDGLLSHSDKIDMYQKPNGELRDYHVENVTITLFLAPIGDPADDAAAEPMYIELDGGYNTSVLTNPVGTRWHEIYPTFCTQYGILGTSSSLQLGDLLALVNNSTAEMTSWHVQEVATDIAVTIEPPAVGGEAYPIDKVSLLAPWIAVAVLLAGGISWYALRRRRAQN